MTMNVLVLGGSGFVGRHAVSALLHDGVNVVVGTRRPGHVSGELPAAAGDCEQREIRLERLLEPRDWEPLIKDVDVVLNCVGILRQRGRETYARVHCEAPAALASACASQQKRFVHVSALGLHADAGSRFLTSKLAGEERIKTVGEDWIIARPSLLDGEGGFGAWWLRRISHLPAFFAPIGADGKIAALDVGELGEALCRLSLGSEGDLNLATSREFDLGGEKHFVFRDYVQALRRRHTDKPSMCIPVPAILARAFAHFCDVIHFTPFSYGHWELLRRDNVPAPNRLPELLGRPPRNVA